MEMERREDGEERKRENEREKLMRSNQESRNPGRQADFAAEKSGHKGQMHNRVMIR